MCVCAARRILVWENPVLYTGLFMMPSGHQWKAQLGQLMLLFAKETVNLMSGPEEHEKSVKSHHGNNIVLS